MLTRALACLFGLLVAARLAYPFWAEPLTRMMGLSGRQWKQAGDFFSPDAMAGVDAFLYQPWLAMVRFISDDEPTIIYGFCGLLCALMPLAWWLCARELLPRRQALLFGIAVAIMPSFLTIYGYFASETLLLPLMGFACWLSARCWKKKSRALFALAALCWALAGFTRIIALPPGIVCLGLLWWRIGFSPRALVAALVCYAALGTAAALYAHKAIGIYTPFGMPAMNAIFARADATKLTIYFDARHQWFRSPSFTEEPLSPLSRWRMTNGTDMITLHINTQQGRASWHEAQRNFPIRFEWMLKQIQRNVTLAAFSPSWPESWPEGWNPDATHRQWEDDINHAACWLWAPLMLLVIISNFNFRGEMLHRAVLCLTLFMMAMLFFQTTAVMEGRYRKPVEPLLMLSAWLIVSHRRQL